MGLPSLKSTVLRLWVVVVVVALDAAVLFRIASSVENSGEESRNKGASCEAVPSVFILTGVRMGSGALIVCGLPLLPLVAFVVASVAAGEAGGAAVLKKERRDFCIIGGCEELVPLGRAGDFEGLVSDVMVDESRSPEGFKRQDKRMEKR